MRDRPELSLVLPAYNEGETIEKAVERMDQIVRQTGLWYELVVVDDGSADDTRMKAANYADNNAHVKVVCHERNQGKGSAMKTGFAHAKGDSIVFVDSDLDIDPEQITRYIEALEDGDLVVASKWHPQSKTQMPMFRKFLSCGFNVLVKLLTGIRMRDTQTGLKAVRRKALKKMFSRLSVKRYAFDVELLAVADLYGLKIVELPVNIQMTRWLFDPRDICRMFIDLLAISYRLRVLKWYQRSSV